MKPKFDCLYHLENKEISIFEIRRTGLPVNAPASEVYQWFRFDKSSAKLSPLHFRSMDSSGEIEERFFEEGYLKFSKSSGTYIEKFNSAQYQLEPSDDKKFGIKLTMSIDSYL